MRIVRFVLAGLFCLTAAAHPARAEQQAGEPQVTAVVELFTSQGCSSCPPADALLKTYASRQDVVALSLPVDYWDYLGWKDSLGNPRHTARQRAYARSRGDGAVYTPQVVVDGRTHVNGASAADIDAAIEKHRAAFLATQVPVRFWMQGGAIVITIGAVREGAEAGEATIWLAIVQKAVEVQIPRGENAGKTLTYRNVVRELAPVGMWSGRPISLRLARSAILRPDVEACAVLIQKGEGGPIIGAAWMGP